MAGVSFEDLEVGKTYLITSLQPTSGRIQNSYLGVPLKDIPGVIIAKQTVDGEKRVHFLSEEMNRLVNLLKGKIRQVSFDQAIFKPDTPLTTAANVESLARQKDLPAAVGFNIASFLNPNLSKSSPENVAAETKFGHTQVPPGHYTKTAVDQAFSAGKRRKTRGRKKSKKTRKSRTRHH
jgi:hypothetical protein